VFILSLALLIYSDLNLVALTSQPLPFSETCMCFCLESAQLTGGSRTVKSTCLNVDIRLRQLIFVIYLLHDTTFLGNFFLYFVRHICVYDWLKSAECVLVWMFLNKFLFA